MISPPDKMIILFVINKQYVDSKIKDVNITIQELNSDVGLANLRFQKFKDKPKINLRTTFVELIPSCRKTL